MRGQAIFDGLAAENEASRIERFIERRRRQGHGRRIGIQQDAEEFQDGRVVPFALGIDLKTLRLVARKGGLNRLRQLLTGVQRIDQLLTSYGKRFAVDYLATQPVPDKPSS